MLTLSQLITPITEDEALATSLTILNQLGFQGTSWQSGSWQLTILRLFSKTWSQLVATITSIAQGGFTTLATSGWLTLLAQYVYGLTRNPAQSCIGQILLTSSAGAPVHTFAAGDIIIADQPNGSSNANTYTCTAGGTIGPSSTLSVAFSANVAGAAANIAPGTTLYLWTPLVGITATNPALAPASNTWITTPGQDPESDQRLASRCLGRWEQLTYGNTDGAYKGWSLTALPAMTRVNVGSAAGDGNITIIGATALGPIDSSQQTIISNYLYGLTDGVGRRPINDIVNVIGASTVTTPAITVTAYVNPNAVDTAGPVINAALLDYIGNLPIGGERLFTTAGVVPVGDLWETARNQTDVRNVKLSITDDIPLLANQIYLPTITVNVSPVAPGS